LGLLTVADAYANVLGPANTATCTDDRGPTIADAYANVLGPANAATCTDVCDPTTVGTIIPPFAWHIAAAKERWRCRDRSPPPGAVPGRGTRRHLRRRRCP
jgi:hypothetical protein